MSRREPAGEVHFGNDSFLDVLANMVGILIILVVIAGARAGKKSLDEAAAAKAAAKAAAETPVPSQSAPSPTPVVAAVAPPKEPEVLKPDSPEDNPPAPPEIARDLDLEPGVRSLDATPRKDDSEEPPAELIARLEELRRETQRLEQLTESEKQALAAAQAREQKSQVKLAGIHEEVAAADQELQSARERLEELQKLLQRDWKQFSGLLAESESTKKAKGPVKQVQHRLTPVSQVVAGEELHFRIENGKVAYVPLEELVDRVKLQMAKQKEWMVKFRRHQGSVGPINGFRMEYVMERQGLSVVDEARNAAARGMVRIGVTSWQIQPEDDFESESVEEALRPGSKFATRLQQAKAETALTFWVYPESFPAFRKLQAAAHSAGFTVSGRPLPTGLPIAGSPQGSRSAGQ